MLPMGLRCAAAESHERLIQAGAAPCYNRAMSRSRLSRMIALPILAALAGAASPAAAAPAGASAVETTGRILFASTRTADGNSDIFSADIAGDLVANLTNHPAPDIAPDWSPDGARVVFSSRREQNWDLYLMNADGSNLQRLTDHPGYDGDPAWSPDGRQVAFASTRGGDLDIYLIDLDDRATQRLTEHEAADYGPSWSPDGSAIAFTSWRDEQQEVYLLDLGADIESEPVNLTNSPAPDYDPAWSPDGRMIAFVSEREEFNGLVVADLAGGRLIPAGPAGRTVSEPSWTPTGGLLAAGTWLVGGQRFSSRQGVLITTPGVPGATFLVGSAHTYADPSWSQRASLPVLESDRFAVGRPVAVAAAPAEVERVEGFTALAGVESGGRTALASDVYPSFVDLRRAVIAESGHDFLAHLSEATRPVDFHVSTASYTSWHKAGRAFDTLFNYAAGGRTVLYIVPEPIAGRLFWRLYLRAASQDGSQGAPLTQPIFNPTARTLLPPPPGYFVDFTALAASHGWRRIAAQERETFNWRSELLALEYWHFERRDGLSWYAAMSLVYDDRTLERLFNVETMIELGVRPGGIGNLGLPWAPPPPRISGPIQLQRVILR
jgi:TolB protein